MKRILCGLLALTLALALGACGNDAPPAESGSGSAAPADADGGLRVLEPGNAAGRYTIGHQDGTNSGDGILTYIDYESLQQVALCADPNCDHTKELCTARGPVSDLYLYGVWIVDDDTLVVEGQQFSQGHATTGLWRCKADGSDPVALDCNEPLPPSYPLLFDGTYLYYESYSDGDSKDALVLYRTPLAGGSNEKVPVTLAGSELVLGCQGRELLLYSSDFSARSAIQAPSGESSSMEDFAAAWAQFEEQYYAAPIKNTLLYKNIDTGEARTLYAWEDTGERLSMPPVYLNGHLLYIDAQALVLKEVLPDGAVREYPLPAVPAEAMLSTMDITAVLGNVAVADVSYYSDPDAIEAEALVANRYAIDLDSGTCSELTLKYMSDGLRPLRIFSFTNDALIVEFEHQVLQNVPYGYTTRCGMLSTQDFLNDRPNYRELSTPYGPLVTDGKTS